VTRLSILFFFWLTLTSGIPAYALDEPSCSQGNQKALTARGLRHLRTLKGNPSDDEGARKTIYRALSIAFAYLYSGRDIQAHQALQKMWPPFDQERVWNLILETRHNGILCYTRKDASCGLDAADESRSRVFFAHKLRTVRRKRFNEFPS